MAEPPGPDVDDLVGTHILDQVEATLEDVATLLRRMQQRELLQDDPDLAAALALVALTQRQLEHIATLRRYLRRPL